MNKEKVSFDLGQEVTVAEKAEGFRVNEMQVGEFFEVETGNTIYTIEKKKTALIFLETLNIVPNQ